LENLIFDQLFSLKKVLSRTEIEIAEKHILAYDSAHTSSNQKMLHIFQNIDKFNNLEINRLKESISPDISLDSFNRLMRRTLYRIQESLIVNVNTMRKGQYSEIFRKRFEIRKFIMQGHILQGRGLPKMANKIYTRVITQAKKFELYDELIETLLLKQSLVMNISNMKKFEKLEKEVLFYQNCRDLLQITKNIYRKYSIDYYAKALKSDKIYFLERKLKKVKRYYEETHSSNILSQYYLLKMEFNYLKDDLEEEENTALSLLELMENNKAVYSRPRISYVYNSLSNSMYASVNFSRAYNYIQKSIQWSKDQGSINYVLALQQQINSIFFLGKYNQADLFLDKLMSLEIIQKYPYYNTKLMFQRAMIFFGSKRFADAKDHLSNLKEIEKDKEGWNVWIRIMRILCSIELLKLNLIDYDVENFRKYLQRISKQYEVRERDRLILSILVELDRSDFDFGEVAQKKSEALAKLQSTDKAYRWDPKSPEMILFHDWFDAKLNKRPYRPNFEPYRQEIKQSIDQSSTDAFDKEIVKKEKN